jgi:anti-anti-sigma factor
VSSTLIDGTTVTLLHLRDETLNEACLRSAVQLLEAPGPQAVHLDLGSIQFPTAEGLGVLVTLDKELRGRGGELVLFNVPPNAMEVLALMHLVELLDIKRYPR